jgi:hypothetical protein
VSPSIPRNVATGGTTNPDRECYKRPGQRIKQRNEWAGERNGEPDRQRDKHSSRRSGRQCDWRGRGLCDGRRRRGDVYGDLDVERRLNLVPEKI